MRTHHFFYVIRNGCTVVRVILFPPPAPGSISFHSCPTFVFVYKLLLPIGEKSGACEISKGNALSKFGGGFVGWYVYFMLEMVGKVYIAL